MAALVALMLAALPSTEAAPSALTEVKIGVSLPMTGPAARWADPIDKAIRLALEDVNRGGAAGSHALETLDRDSSALGPDRASRTGARSRTTNSSWRIRQ